MSSLSAPSPKTPACVVCQQRKVKCDRQSPCLNCVKNEVQCVYRAHPPPRRRKRRQSEVVDEHSTRLSRPRQPETPLTPPRASESNQSGILLAGGGRSVYLDSNLWGSVQHELPAADVLQDIQDTSSGHEDLEDETSLVFVSGSKRTLTGLHPSPLHIFKLWQTFLENVNPLVKIIHAPTVQQRLLDATSDLAQVSKEFEALMFSIYCISLVSLSPNEVQSSFGQSKATLLAKYRRGARMAFANTGILRSSDMTVLQAFVIFLLAMRAFSDPQSVWALCGIAVRMAQRMGLHRDGSHLRLSPFETEMRRRLWLQLSILDATTAHSSGVTSQASTITSDVKPPSNVNDSALDPCMTDSPREEDGLTEMMFCLARSEFGQWLTRWSKDAGAGGGWAFLTSSSLSLAEKDKAIDELSDRLESKFLRHCDVSIPLHFMTSIMIKSVVSLMSLTAHHPRQSRNHVTESEKNRIFSICLQVAENCHTVQTSHVTQRYQWHIENHIPWDALIYMLYEMRHCADHDKTRKAWLLIDEIYSRYFEQHGHKSRNPLELAMYNVILKVWKTYTDSPRRNQVSIACPRIVSLLSTKSDNRSSPQYSERPSAGREKSQESWRNCEADSEALFDNFDVNDVGDFDLSSIDWVKWDGLLEQFQREFPDHEGFLAGE